MFFRVTENSPQLIWRSADEGEIGDKREKRSMSAPDKICVLMLLATGGGSKVRAFGGMGRGMVEDREKEERAWGGGKVSAGTACGGMLVLETALGAEEKGGKRGGLAVVGACAISGGVLMLELDGGAVGHG